MRSTVCLLLRDVSGATMIEYGLIALLIAVAAFGALGLIGSGVSSSLTNAAGSIP